MSGPGKEHSIEAAPQGFASSGLEFRAKQSIFLAAVLILPVFIVFQLNLGFQMGDEGVALTDAWRLTQGQVPYRDFFEIIPPLSFALTAAVFKTFGVGLLQSRLLTAFYAVLLVLLTDRLVARFTKDLLARAAAIAFLTPFGVWYWPMPSHHWVAALFQLGATLSLLSAFKRGSLPLGVLSGSLAGLAALALQDQGLVYIAAVPIFCARSFFGTGGRRKLFWGWLGAVAAIALCFLTYLVFAGALSDFWRQDILFPLRDYRGLPGNRSSLLAGWEFVRASISGGELARKPAYLGSLLLMTGVLSLLPFGGVGGMVAAYRGKWAGKPELGALASLVAAFFATCARRWALTNVVWSAAPMIILYVWCLDRLAQSGAGYRRCFGRWALWGLTALSIVFSLAYLNFSAPGACVTVRTPAGQLRSYLPVEARTLQETIDAIETHVPPGAPLFCKGYLALINFLSQRPNPTRFTVFVYPGYNNLQELREAGESLTATPAAFVLVMLPIQGDELDWQIMRDRKPVWQTSYAVLFGPATGAGHAGR